MQLEFVRSEVERMRVQVLRQRGERLFFTTTSMLDGPNATTSSFRQVKTQRQTISKDCKAEHQYRDLGSEVRAFARAFHKQTIDEALSFSDR